MIPSMLHIDRQLYSAEPVLNRRRFLKFLGTGALGLAATACTTNELETVKNGYLETSLGRFYDVIERHDYRTIYQDSLELPENCAGYLVESGIFPGMMRNTDPLNRHILNLQDGFDTNPPSVRFVFSDSILQRLAQQQVPILMGDYNFNSFARAAGYTGDQEALGGRVILGGATQAALATLCGYEWLHKKIGHRAKLKAAIGGAALILEKPLIEYIFETQQWFTEQYANPNPEYRRALARIQGLMSHLSPENINVFFRNVYVAHKLLFYAEQLYKNDHSPHNFLYQYQGGHYGIRDFLQLGQAGCERILLSMSPDFLKVMIEGCGGLYDFCSIRAITLSSDFQASRELVCNEQGDQVQRVLEVQGRIIRDSVYTNQTFANKLQHKLPDAPQP